MDDNQAALLLGGRREDDYTNPLHLPTDEGVHLILVPQEASWRRWRVDRRYASFNTVTQLSTPAR